MHVDANYGVHTIVQQLTESTHHTCTWLHYIIEFGAVKYASFCADFVTYFLAWHLQEKRGAPPRVCANSVQIAVPSKYTG